jgi:hypothetical protein
MKESLALLFREDPSVRVTVLDTDTAGQAGRALGAVSQLLLGNLTVLFGPLGDEEGVSTHIMAGSVPVPQLVLFPNSVSNAVLRGFSSGAALVRTSSDFGSALGAVRALFRSFSWDSVAVLCALEVASAVNFANSMITGQPGVKVNVQFFEIDGKNATALQREFRPLLDTDTRIVMVLVGPSRPGMDVMARTLKAMGVNSAGSAVLTVLPPGPVVGAAPAMFGRRHQGWLALEMEGSVCGSLRDAAGIWARALRNGSAETIQALKGSPELDENLDLRLPWRVSSVSLSGQLERCAVWDPAAPSAASDSLVISCAGQRPLFPGAVSAVPWSTPSRSPTLPYGVNGALLGLLAAAWCAAAAVSAARQAALFSHPRRLVFTFPSLAGVHAVLDAALNGLQVLSLGMMPDTEATALLAEGPGTAFLSLSAALTRALAPAAPPPWYVRGLVIAAWALLALWAVALAALKRPSLAILPRWLCFLAAAVVLAGSASVSPVRAPEAGLGLPATALIWAGAVGVCAIADRQDSMAPRAQLSLILGQGLVILGRSAYLVAPTPFRFRLYLILQVLTTAAMVTLTRSAPGQPFMAEGTRVLSFALRQGLVLGAAAGICSLLSLSGSLMAAEVIFFAVAALLFAETISALFRPQGETPVVMVFAGFLKDSLLKTAAAGRFLAYAIDDEIEAAEASENKSDKQTQTQTNHQQDDDEDQQPTTSPPLPALLPIEDIFLAEPDSCDSIQEITK